MTARWNKSTRRACWILLLTAALVWICVSVLPLAQDAKERIGANVAKDSLPQIRSQIGQACPNAYKPLGITFSSAWRTLIPGSPRVENEITIVRNKGEYLVTVRKFRGRMDFTETLIVISGKAPFEVLNIHLKYS